MKSFLASSWPLLCDFLMSVVQAKIMSSGKCTFSVDFILNVAGNGRQSRNILQEPQQQCYDWLHCTRYRPPKLLRQKKRDGVQRRNLGRNPRIPFSSAQIALLEAKFAETPYLSSTDVLQLAHFLDLSETRVKIWFQNRRARERRERESCTSRKNIADEDDNKKCSNNPNPNVIISSDDMGTSGHFPIHETDNGVENPKNLSQPVSKMLFHFLPPILHYGYLNEPIVK